ncbi:MAG: hypothetical protein IJN29_01800 [Akkermansia sp.]|nr:hypothetical protein [Akkermansia sp.]
MKLHLPRALFTAVIAAFAVSQTVWADWGEGDAANTYYTATETVDLVDATSEGKGTTITISPTGEITTPTISNVSVKSGDTLNISGADSTNFNPLTITSISINSAGNAMMNVNDSQNVVLNGVSQGTLNVTVGQRDSNGTAASYKSASLTLNDGVSIGTLNGNAGTTTINGEVSINNVNLGDGGKNDGDVLVKAGAQLTAAQYWNHTGSTGAINVEKGGSLNVSGLNLTGTSDTESAKIKRTSNDGGKYALTSSDFTISNGQISVANGGTINNILSNVEVLHTANTGLTINSTIENTVTIHEGTTGLVTINDVLLAGKVLNNADANKLTVAGTWTIDDLSQLEAKGDASISFVLDSNNLDATNESQNGFAVSTGSYWVVEGQATLAEDAKLTNATGTTDYTMTSDESGIYFSTDSTVDYSRYYITEGIVDVNANLGAESYVVQGGTLNLNTALADGVKIQTKSVTGSNVINLGAGVTLANDSVKNEGSTKATLKGDATAIYDMGSITWNGSGSNGGQSPNVAFGDDWKGTTVITNSVITNHNLNEFGSEASKIKLVGVTGWMAMNGTISRDLILEDYVDAETPANSRSAFIFNDNSEDKTYTFAKSISGSGHFQVASTAQVAANIVFSGDTSEWTGGIIVTNAYNGDADTPTLTVKLNGGGNIFNADSNAGFVMERSRTDNNTNTINLEIGKADADSTMNGAISMGENLGSAATLHLKVVGNTEFKQDATVTHMTVAADKTATGAGDITVTKNLTLNGAESINLTGSLVLADGATLTLSDSLVSTIVNGTETSYTLAVAGNITEGIQLTNTGNWFGEKFSGYELTVQDYAGPAMLDGEGTSGQKALVLTLTQAADPLTSITVNNGSFADGVLTLQTNVEDAAAVVFGDTLNATMSDEVWDSILEVYGDAMGEQVKVSFADAAGNLLDFDGANNTDTAPTITINGEGTVGEQQITGNGTIVGNYVTAYIPEPTSTTLSLLALAALAVRRRRK